MKKSWMIGVMLLGALTTQAQWKITPEAGFNVTKYTNSPAKIGYKVGAAVSYDFGKSGFALQSGLYYVQRGNGSYDYASMYGKSIDENGNEISIYYSIDKDGSYTMSYPAGGYYAGYAENSHVNSGQPIDWQEVTFVHKNASRYGFVQLPILARYTWTVKPNIRIHVALGPYIAIGVNGKKSLHAKIIDLKKSSESIYENKSNPFDYGNRFDWGVAAETGVEINRFSAKFSYDMGLSDDYGRNNIGIEYHTASFTIGYSF